MCRPRAAAAYSLIGLTAAVAAVAAVTAASAGDGPRAVAPGPAWAFPVPAKAARPTAVRELQTLAGSTTRFTGVQLIDRTAAVDWFPDNHPPMPSAVAGGVGTAFACGYCHLPEGQGRPENAALAGLPYAYLVQQLRDMKSGARKLIDSRFGPGALMLQAIDHTSDAAADQAARYFSGLRYTKRVKVIEAVFVPQFTAEGYVYVFDRGGPRQRLGDRIIEGPDDFERFEKRDSRVEFTAYVPVGSIARGAALAKGDGKSRQACAICHGAGLRGGPIGPPIAGRYPTEIFRQLYAFQIGTRTGATATLMRPNAVGLSQSDLIDLAAYVGSLKPAVAQ